MTLSQFSPYFHKSLPSLAGAATATWDACSKGEVVFEMPHGNYKRTNWPTTRPTSSAWTRKTLGELATKHKLKEIVWFVELNSKCFLNHGAAKLSYAVALLWNNLGGHNCNLRHRQSSPPLIAFFRGVVQKLCTLSFICNFWQLWGAGTCLKINNWS